MGFFYFPQYSTNPLYSYPYGRLTLPNWMIFWDLVGKNLVIVCKSLLVKCQTVKYSLNLPKKSTTNVLGLEITPIPKKFFWKFIRLASQQNVSRMCVFCYNQDLVTPWHKTPICVFPCGRWEEYVWEPPASFCIRSSPKPALSSTRICLPYSQTYMTTLEM